MSWRWANLPARLLRARLSMRLGCRAQVHGEAELGTGVIGPFRLFEIYLYATFPNGTVSISVVGQAFWCHLRVLNSLWIYSQALGLVGVRTQTRVRVKALKLGRYYLPPWWRPPQG